MFKILSIIIGFYLQCLVFPQTYNWPCQPFDQQHWINGTFCECRSGSSGDIDHFHDGIDIHLPEGNAVYSVIDAAITSIGTPSQYGINSWVRAGRYAYVHVNPNTALSVGDSVQAFETILGWTNSWNHIHFKDGYPGSEINAIRLSGGISPLNDTFNPNANWIRFYQNNTNTQFYDNRISGQVDIVCNATDLTDDGPIGDNNGIYKIGFEIVNQSGETIYGPRFPFEFYQIPATDNYIDNVYFNGSNTGTYNYIITNNINGDNYLDVSGWDTGFYTAKILVYDHYLNADTTEISFEVVEPDMVPPAPPQILFMLPENDGFHLRWAMNEENDLAGYRLYFSYDLQQWHTNHNESILTADMAEYHAPSFSFNTGYFKMTAVDDAPFPNESDYSDIYVFRKNQNDQGLQLIDAYNPGVLSTEPFAANAGIIATNYDMGISTVNHSAITDSTDHEYLPVVLSGNQQLEWSNDFTHYLIDTPFCIIGSKSLSALYSTNEGSSFLESIGVSLGGNISPPDQLIGIGEPFIGFNANETINEALFDSLNIFTISTANEDVTPIIQDPDGNILAIAFLSSPFIISLIPLELFDYSERSDYFFRMISHLTGITADVYNENAIIPNQLSLRFYPNPFNNKGYINIHGHQGEYSLRLYTILGQLIWQEKILFEKNMRKQFEIPADKINLMSSGVYFIHVASTAGKTATQKLLYLK